MMDDEPSLPPLQPPPQSSPPPQSKSKSKSNSTSQSHRRPLTKIYDDFSLPGGSSSEIRFRNNNNKAAASGSITSQPTSYTTSLWSNREFRIYEQAGAQLILEQCSMDDDDDDDDNDNYDDDDDDGLEEGQEGDNAVNNNNNNNNNNKKKQYKRNKGNPKGINIKHTSSPVYSLTFLRATYTLMTIFVGGFLFILGFDILLFLFIDLATQLGVTHHSKVDAGAFVAVGLSVPVFVYSLSFAMTLVTRFVIDTFQGHPLLNSFGWGKVTTDWMAFIMFLAIPMITFIITLYGQREDFWEVSLLTWFSSILVFWGFFCACVLWHEVKECLFLIGHVDDTLGEDAGYFEKAKRSILCTMGSRLSGTRTTRYKIDHVENNTDQDGSEKNEDAEGTSFFPKYLPFLYNKGDTSEEGAVSSFCPEGPFSLISKWKWLSCMYTKVNPSDPCNRVYTIDEARGNATFITRSSWSLEKLFFRRGGLLSAIPITFGTSGITPHQINSNIACKLIGTLIIILLFGGIIVWYELVGGALGIVLVFLLIVVLFADISTYRLWEIKKDVDEGKETIRYWKVHKVTKPSDQLVWTVTWLEIILFYLLPLLYMCIDQNAPSALLFTFLGLFSGLRHFLNPGQLLQQMGPGYFRRRNGLNKSEWKNKNRFYKIAELGSDSSRSFWTAVYGFLVVFFMLTVIVAARDAKDGSTEDENYGLYEGSEVATFVSGFRYDPQPHLPYPTCQLKKGLELGNENAALVDYAFLSRMAYAVENDTQPILDIWFGENVTKNNVELVTEFRSVDSELNFDSTAVSYKVITFPNNPGVAIVTIKGTSTIWDIMADAQLWLSAGLFQGLRELLPLGNVFTPILHKMVKFVSALETKSIDKVSYYKETKRLVDYLKETGYTSVHVTGHSLGGGLALITGAQSNSSAVGLSAPNAMLSRETFSPMITEEQLNTLTLNIVPARDVVPMLDDKARLFQNINCTAAQNENSCHGSLRSLCEIQYTCGSGSRPVPCECALNYKYPEPLSTDQTNFTQACLDAKNMY